MMIGQPVTYKHPEKWSDLEIWKRIPETFFGLKLPAPVDRTDTYFFVFTIYILSVQKSISSLNV